MLLNILTVIFAIIIMCVIVSMCVICYYYILLLLFYRVFHWVIVLRLFLGLFKNSLKEQNLF